MTPRALGLVLLAGLALCLVLGFDGAMGIAGDIGSPVPPAAADPAAAVELHYAPVEDLEAIDVALIAGARRAIDMAAYLLTDRPVLEALRAAARRGVVIRIYRSRDDLARWPTGAAHEALAALAATPGVTIRTKRATILMHLKSYCIDGAALRSGAANFTASGERAQDNDLVVIRDPAACARFEAEFAAIWEQGE